MKTKPQPKNAAPIKSFDALKEKMTKSVNDYVVEFGHEFGMGIEAIKRAAKIYADALLKHPTTAQARFTETYPTISPFTWEILERIGNNDLDPHAMLLPYAVADKVAKIPMEKQERIFKDANKGFQVINPSTLRARTVPVAALSVRQASILIDEDAGRIRTIDEQKKIVEERNAAMGKPSKPGAKPPIKYQILGNVVRIYGIEIGKETLKKILREMEGMNPL